MLPCLNQFWLLEIEIIPSAVSSSANGKAPTMPMPPPPMEVPAQTTSAAAENAAPDKDGGKPGLTGEFFPLQNLDHSGPAKEEKEKKWLRPRAEKRRASREAMSYRFWQVNRATIFRNFQAFP